MEESFNFQQHSKSAPAVDEAGITLPELFRAMRSKWVWYVVSIVVCLALAVLYLLRATPMYTRSTEILLKDDQSQSITGDLSMLGLNPVPSELLNEMFVMTSPEIMEQVVNRLQLNHYYATPKRLRSQVLYHTSPVSVEFADSLGKEREGFGVKMEIDKAKNGVTFTKFIVRGKTAKTKDIFAEFGKEVNTPVGPLTVYPTKFLDTPAVEGEEIPTKITYIYTPLVECARSYCKKLKSENSEDRGNVITLTISCPSAAMASDVLRSVVDAYNQRWVADRNKIAEATSKFIDERLDVIEDELGDVENNITDYKSSHRMMDLNAMAEIYLTQSSENQRSLNQLVQEMAVGRSIKSLLSDDDITRMLPVTGTIGDTNIQQMIADYNKLVGERNVKLETLPEESPVIAQKTRNIMQLRDAILKSVDAALVSLDKRYNAIRLVDNKTQDKLATAPGQAKYLMSEERKQRVKASLYMYLLQRREENELSQAFTIYNTRMVTAPYGPSGPTSPNNKLVLLLAIMVGILIPTLIIYIREVSNTKVRSRKDIDSLPIPFLGEVPMASDPVHKRLLGPVKPDADSETRKIIVRPRQGDVVNEAFRMIRTNIDFMGAMRHSEGTTGKTIMVVSLNAGSGKTFVALNTAAIFALKGKKTILVDFDLRKGIVSKNVNSPSHGVVDYLIGTNRNLDQLIVRNVDGIQHFDILPEGAIPPNPTELLYTPNLKALIDELRERYDYVIFDCPPIEIVADARLLNPYIDMTIFVMRSGLFEKGDISELRSLYEEKRYNNLTLVLNGTDTLHGVYGSYGYGYRTSQRAKK